MPIYCYRCLGCQAEVELARPVAERNLPLRCPGCQGSLVRRYVPAMQNFAGSRSDDAITKFQFEHLAGD